MKNECITALAETPQSKKKPKRRIMTFSSIAAQTYLSGKTSSTLLRPTLITNCAQRLFLSVSLSAIIDGKMSWFFYCLQPHFWGQFCQLEKRSFRWFISLDYFCHTRLLWDWIFSILLQSLCCYIISVLIFELSLIGIFICLNAI